MGHRRNEWRERLVEHMTVDHEPAWDREKAERLADKIGHHSLLSDATALWLLEEIRATNSQVDAEIAHDRVFAPDFPMPIIERPDAGQLNPPHQVQ